MAIWCLFRSFYDWLF